ncbi:MAG: lysine--tRNA ligase [Desulfobacterales bacterium]
MEESKSGKFMERRNKKTDELTARGVRLYPNDVRITHTVQDLRDAIAQTPDALSEESPVFTIAGRMMAVNMFGKAAFIRLTDRAGQIQAYIRRDKVGADAFSNFKLFDIGDFVSVKGGLFTTKTGEWTVLAREITLVCKSARPLPEKFHGLKDPEKRYRQRYLDLIMNRGVRDIFFKRSRTIQVVREFLLEHNFLEVETPMMQPIPGGAEAEPFTTRHNALGMDLYLRIAPELYLKRLVVGGFERVFEINRNFRNEGISTQHNPEFTMAEFYQAYASYTDLMDLTERMLCRVAEDVTGSPIVSYQGNEIDFSQAFRRMTLASALETIGGIAPEIQQDKEKLLEFAAGKGVNVTKTRRLGKVITKLFDALVEPHLIQPTFITEYPVEVSPLSRKCDADPMLTERFELFVGGREIANGFSELNDPEDQHRRFQQQVEDREAGDKEAHFMDADYIEALSYGMPPTAGEGIGIDRLVMLLTDSASIREVILFPHMKPKG